MTEISIGIDISKDHLDAHRLPDGAAGQFANSKAGLTRLIRWIGVADVARVVFEPTGRYHRDLERRLGEAGYPLAKVRARPGGSPGPWVCGPRPIGPIPRCWRAWERRWRSSHSR